MKEELKSSLTVVLVLVVRHQVLRGEMLDCGSSDTFWGPELMNCTVMLKGAVRELWKAISLVSGCSLTEDSEGQVLVNTKEEKEW